MNSSGWSRTVVCVVFAVMAEQIGKLNGHFQGNALSNFRFYLLFDINSPSNMRAKLNAPVICAVRPNGFYGCDCGSVGWYGYNLICQLGYGVEFQFDQMYKFSRKIGFFNIICPMMF